MVIKYKFVIIIPWVTPECHAIHGDAPEPFHVYMGFVYSLTTMLKGIDMDSIFITFNLSPMNSGVKIVKSKI